MTKVKRNNSLTTHTRPPKMIFHWFQKKEKEKKINIEELDEWIKKTIETKNLNLKISMFKRELNSKKIRIKELLDELKKTQVKDESVLPERAKNIFEGNKNAYIQKVNAFLNNLIFPEEISKTETFLENTYLELETLATDTNKNYFIIKEFAEDEVRSVANKIKELDKIITNARITIEKTPLHKFKDLKEQQQEYHKSIKGVENTKKLLEEVLEKKAKEIAKRKKVESKINSIKNSEQHLDYTNLKNNQEKLFEKIKETEYKIIELFSGISSVLKKYDKKKSNNVAKNYSENAVKGLLKDDSLKILSVLENINKLKKDLDLKDSKLKKIELSVKKINKTLLGKLKQDLTNKNKELEELNRRLKNHPFKLNLKEQEGIISIIDETIKEIEKEEQDLEDILERNNPRLIKQKMNKIIKEINEKTELI